MRACCSGGLGVEADPAQPACDLTAAEAQKRYPAQLGVVTEAHGWSHVKVKGKVWTKELSKEVRPKADVWDRWNSTIKPYLINVIQPLYQSLLVDTGGKTKSKPSGTNAKQLEYKLKQLLYAQTAKPKKKPAKKKKKATVKKEKTCAESQDDDYEEEDPSVFLVQRHNEARSIREFLPRLHTMQHLAFRCSTQRVYLSASATGEACI